MNCLECRGACCESFSIPIADVKPPGPDERSWLELHGTREGDSIAFECRCTALTADGRCSIYEGRPLVCVFYAPGGPDCLETVRRRRTPEQYQRIRGADDPESIH
jgi:Fe-S-cluster containining protein